MKIVKKTILLSLCLIFALNGYTQHNPTKRNGVYLGGQKGWNIFKAKKKYKHVGNKKNRKKLKKRNNNYKKSQNFKRHSMKKLNHRGKAFKRNGKVKKRKTTMGRKGTLYSYKKKKNKNRKGFYPKSKSQLNSKMTAYASSGVIMTNSNENYTANNDLINVYSNYKASPHLTVGLNYNHTSKLSFGGDARVFILKSNAENLGLKLNTVALGFNLKYNFISTQKPVSPYICLGPTFSFTQFKKQELKTQEPLPSTTTDSSVTIEGAEKIDPGFKTQIIPLYGLKIGIGVDLKISNKMSAFVQFDQDFSSARNKQQVLDYFDKNKANYIFYGVSFGVKYNLFQKTSLY
jgi:hypothetical protein